MNEFNDVFRKRLKVCMAVANTTQRELSEKTGISYDMVGKYLRGESIPTFRNAILIAGALQCTPNDLSGIDPGERVG